MAKKKPVINCETCFFGEEIEFEQTRINCRVEPAHRRINRTHWCGKYITEKVGKDLIERPDK